MFDEGEESRKAPLVLGEGGRKKRGGKRLAGRYYPFWEGANWPGGGEGGAVAWGAEMAMGKKDMRGSHQRSNENGFSKGGPSDRINLRKRRERDAGR